MMLRVDGAKQSETSLLTGEQKRKLDKLTKR